VHKDMLAESFSASLCMQDVVQIKMLHDKLKIQLWNKLRVLSSTFIRLISKNQRTLLNICLCHESPLYNMPKTCTYCLIRVVRRLN
jgi:hypothetical protein